MEKDGARVGVYAELWRVLSVTLSLNFCRYNGRKRSENNCVKSNRSTGGGGNNNKVIQNLKPVMENEKT